MPLPGQGVERGSIDILNTMPEETIVQPSSFVHLHCHTHYSLLDGLNKIPDLVKKCKEFNMGACAITDHGNMHGALEFYKECNKHGVKPIIGLEAYVANRSRFDKDAGIDNKRFHLTLLARNEQGYKNLMKISSKAFLEGYYYKPRADKELLKQYGEGIICLTGCPASEFIFYLKNGDRAKAEGLIDFYVEIFGHEHVFVEIMRHDEVDWYVPLKDIIFEIALKKGLHVVATWDSHYTCKEDHPIHDVLLEINTNNKEFKLTGDYHFINEHEAHEIYEGFGDAVVNTTKVADLVDIKLDLGNWYFPPFPIPEGETHDSLLRKKVYEKVTWRYKELTDEIKDRIEHELDVIAFKGFSIYILIVADLLEYAHNEGILTNIRGSVAGSIVTYLLGITSVDPLYFKLPFTRFLNRERPSAPDIDMDMADNRRDDMLDYARRKYGRDAVAQIGTFGTMAARGSVRDVARSLGYSYETGDKISKLIPLGQQGATMTLEKALKIEPDFKKLYDSDNDVKKIVDIAKKIEGSARHVSVHAAGVVISPTGHVDDFAPVQLDPKGGKIITQYDMHYVEDSGLIKFDFLGLRNLGILKEALDRVEKIRGIKIDLDNLPQNDPKTFEMLARGDTEGVFQLSGGGMTKWLMELKPSSIDDINAMLALFRPGPMEMIPEYIKRKHNPSLIRFADPRLRNILDRSYGVIVYQDDVMLISIELGGYSWLEADKLRKAMGKKIPEVLQAEKEKLMKGFEKNGVKPEVMEELWTQIEPFAMYGFNKAHAASYGQLSYRTAYMKAHYPHEFMSAIMTAESGDLEKVADIITECKRMGFQILPPDVNESYSDFTVVLGEDKQPTDEIRFGLNNVKNLGEDIGKAIIHERKAGGKFTSFENFLERVTHKNLNKKSLEALTMCGALDEMMERNAILANMDTILAFHKELKEMGSAQDSLFGDSAEVKPKLRLAEVDPVSKERMLLWEKDLLGLYVSGHPLDKFKDRLAKSNNSTQRIAEYGRNNESTILGGMISAIKEVVTKKGDKMAILTLTDYYGTIEAVLFPEAYKENRELCVVDSVIAVTGKITERNEQKNIIVEKVKVLG